MIHTSKRGQVLLMLCVFLLACSERPSCRGATPRAPVQATLPEEDERERWLRRALLEDNRELLGRDPVLTTGKFLKMASTPYNYYRGTANLFLRDASETPTAYASPNTAHVLVLGDPHPENLGTYRGSDGTMYVDFNDFDAATYGPYHLDVWRLATGFALIAHLAGRSLDDNVRDALPAILAASYIKELRAIHAGAPGRTLQAPPGRGASLGPILGDLIRRAERDGRIREEFEEYTELRDGERVVRYGEVESPETWGVYRDTVRPVEGAEARTLRALLAEYPKTLSPANPGRERPETFRVKGTSRRLGAGVSSYPVRRYYVLIEGATPAQNDDVLLEFKEILGPWKSPGAKAPQYGSEAERVVTHQRVVQTTRDNDLWLGWARGPYSARVRERSKYQKGVDAQRIIEGLEDGDLESQDVRRFAEQTARLLARAHGATKTLEGKRGATVILADLGGDPQGFIEEVSQIARAQLERVLGDYDRFCVALERRGHDLGWGVHDAASGEGLP